MAQIPAIPRAKRGQKPKLQPRDEKAFITAYLATDANRSEVSRLYNLTPSGGLMTAKRILRENPHFLKLSGASEETPYATNHEGQPHNHTDYTSPDAEGISALQQAA
jgi:hypothetical protein